MVGVAWVGVTDALFAIISAREPLPFARKLPLPEVLNTAFTAVAAVVAVVAVVDTYSTLHLDPPCCTRCACCTHSPVAPVGPVARTTETTTQYLPRGTSTTFSPFLPSATMTTITTAIAALGANGVFAENIYFRKCFYHAIAAAAAGATLATNKASVESTTVTTAFAKSNTTKSPQPPLSPPPPNFHHRYHLALSCIGTFTTFVVNLLGVTSAAEKNYSRQLHKPIISEGSAGGMRKLGVSYGRERWRELVPLSEGEAVWEAVRRVREVRLI